MITNIHKNITIKMNISNRDVCVFCPGYRPKIGKLSTYLNNEQEYYHISLNGMDPDMKLALIIIPDDQHGYNKYIVDLVRYMLHNDGIQLDVNVPTTGICILYDDNTDITDINVQTILELIRRLKIIRNDFIS